MAMRLSGLISGMDTDSVIQQLVAAKSTKVDKAKKAQTKLEWKTDAWKDLNKKLKSFQSKYLNNMRFTSAYAEKTTKVSNSSAVSVLTSDKAMNSVQSLDINELAKTAYMTGGKIKPRDGVNDVSAITTMRGLGIIEGAALYVKQGDKTTTVTVNADSTISDVLNQLKDAGLNASFDANQKRLFISATESGAAGNFEITAANDAGEHALETLGLAKAPAGFDPETATNEEREKYAAIIEGQDARITLNGATFTSSNNVFEINGLTITALDRASNVTLTTEVDTDGIYDMIKNFIKDYSELVNEMDKLYNADSTKGYEPLTDDEKESMSDAEIEKWENKIKESLLRRDGNLYNVNSALQTIMAERINIKGKNMSLSDFGIGTLSYFVAEDNERHAYHIDGNEDDENTSANEDKLKQMIAADPDTVMSFFTQLTQKMYTKMNELSTSVEDYRSFGSFYDDKKMKTDYKDYTRKISDLEKKLQDYEDKWYSKFAAMEKAMAKLQESTSAITSLLGGS